MLHDDGQHPENWNSADVLLIGVSRSSKTPTSIYLANRGVKTANIPFVPSIPMPPQIESLSKPLVVGLTASAERIAQIRRHRLLTLNEDRQTSYANRQEITRELTEMKTLCQRHNWPIIDVTRRSIEETAAAVLNLLNEREAASA